MGSQIIFEHIAENCQEIFFLVQVLLVNCSFDIKTKLFEQIFFSHFYGELIVNYTLPEQDLKN